MMNNNILLFSEVVSPESPLATVSQEGPFTGEEAPISPDILSAAAQQIFGLSYLYPYQRLVITNILEGAQRAGISLMGPPELMRAFQENPEQAQGAEIDPEAQEPPGARGSEAQDGIEERAGAYQHQIVVLPTGAGKSLCFLLPALLMERPTLVLYPLLALMEDQRRRLEARGIQPLILRGGQTPEERHHIWDRLREHRAGTILIANPEVLCTPSVWEHLPGLTIGQVVVDEAHCVSEWGESFRPSYLEVGNIIQQCKAPLVTAFTATASPPVLEKIRHYIFPEGEAHTILANPDRPNISYQCQGAVLKDLAVRDILRSVERPAIVFCGSRTRTWKLAHYLAFYYGYERVRFYHAGLEKEEKKAIEEWFFASQEGILVATCAYGMGVDKSNIRTVIHRDIPPSVEAYLQEAGRAGRDGKPSTAILVWGPEDELGRGRRTDAYHFQRYQELFAYGRSADRCRREQLLAFLGHEGTSCVPGPTACDVCQGKANSQWRETRALVEYVKKHPRRFTVPELSRLLMDPLFGCSFQEGERLLHHLVQAGYLKERRSWWLRGRLEVPY